MYNSCTRAENVRAQEAYTIANRSIKNSIKAKKRNFVEALAAEAEVAALHGNMKALYTFTRKLSGKFAKPEGLVKDKQRKVIQGDERQNKWRELFEELLNRPAPRDPPDIHIAESREGFANRL